MRKQTNLTGHHHAASAQDEYRLRKAKWTRRFVALSILLIPCAALVFYLFPHQPPKPNSQALPRPNAIPHQNAPLAKSLPESDALLKEDPHPEQPSSKIPELLKKLSEDLKRRPTTQEGQVKQAQAVEKNESDEESIEEAIDSFMPRFFQEGAMRMRFSSSVTPGPLARVILREPMVASLVERIRSGDAQTQKAAVDAICSALSRALETLPSYYPSGQPVSGSGDMIAASPGLDALGVIAAEVDKNATSLPVLLRVYDARQTALQERRASEKPDLPPQEVMYSPNVALTVYACEQLLNRYLEDPALCAKLSASQLAALESFSQYERWRSQQPEIGPDDDQLIIEVASQIAGDKRATVTQPGKSLALGAQPHFPS